MVADGDGGEGDVPDVDLLRVERHQDRTLVPLGDYLEVNRFAIVQLILKLKLCFNVKSVVEKMDHIHVDILPSR